MVLKRNLLLTVLLVLSVCFFTMAFTLNNVYASDDPFCYFDGYVYDYWCGPDNKYYEGTYEAYYCPYKGTTELYAVGSRVISDFCPYFASN